MYSLLSRIPSLTWSTPVKEHVSGWCLDCSNAWWFWEKMCWIRQDGVIFCIILVQLSLTVLVVLQQDCVPLLHAEPRRGHGQGLRRGDWANAHRHVRRQSIWKRLWRRGRYTLCTHNMRTCTEAVHWHFDAIANMTGYQRFWIELEWIRLGSLGWV